MADTSPIDLAPTRREILTLLRKHGEESGAGLARALEITDGAVRQHLRPLCAAGLVQFREERSGPGRPRRLYRLAPLAEELFPKAYAPLTTELLRYVDEEDPELLARVFERRRRSRVAAARARLEGLDFGPRVAELAAILDEQGYLAEFDELPDGTFRITEHNCAILAVAREHGHACSTEISFLREVMPDAEITRVAHLLSGSHACVYELRRAEDRVEALADVGPTAYPRAE